MKRNYFWNNLLLDWNRTNPGARLPKSVFAQYIGRVWSRSFKKSYLVSGFKTTGLFPLDKSMFPCEEFDPLALARFRNQSQEDIQPGSTVVADVQMTQNSRNTTASTDIPPGAVQDPVNIHTASQPTTPSSSITSTAMPTPSDVENVLNRSTTPPSQYLSFEQFIRESLSKQHRPSGQNPRTMSSGNLSRVRLSDQYGEILTTEDAMQRLKEMSTRPTSAKKRNRPTQKKIPTGQTKKDKKRMSLQSSSTSSESEIDLSLNDENSTDIEDDVEPQAESEPGPAAENQPGCSGIPTVPKRNTTQENNEESGRPNEADEESEDDDVGLFKLEKYYAVYYERKWYVGGIIKISNGQSKATIKFLEKKETGKFDWPRRPDVEEIDRKFIFYGPLELNGIGPFTLLLYDIIKSKYEAFKKEIKHSNQ